MCPPPTLTATLRKGNVDWGLQDMPLFSSSWDANPPVIPRFFPNAWLLISSDHGNKIMFQAASRQSSGCVPASSTGGHFSIQSNVQICLFGHKCASSLHVKIALGSGNNSKLASFWRKSHISLGKWKGTQSFTLCCRPSQEHRLCGSEAFPIWWSLSVLSVLTICQGCKCHTVLVNLNKGFGNRALS